MRKVRIHRLVAVAAACAALMAPASSSAGEELTSIAPPFDAAVHESDCTTPPIADGACSSDTSADAATGALSASATLATAAGGAIVAPGSSAEGVAAVVKTHTIGAPTKGLVYVVRGRIDDLALPKPPGSRWFAGVTAMVGSRSCECFGAQTLDLSRPTRDGEFVLFVPVHGSREGGIPAGDMTVAVQLHLSASALAAPASSNAGSVAVTITDVAYTDGDVVIWEDRIG